MSRLGLKYISPDGLNFPAVNGGKWNIASNLRGDFNRILSESGVEHNDYGSVLLFIKFIASGMLLVAVKRRESKVKKHGTESTWLFVPSETDITDSELRAAVEEMVNLFDHPEAFTSSDIFRDHLSAIFSKDFPDRPTKEEMSGMTGSRIGYLSFESQEELEIILSSGFKSQYENFGMILITDNPVPVEASLPRIYLPELMIHRQLSREAAAAVEKETEEKEKTEEKENTENPSEKIDIPEDESLENQEDMYADDAESASREDKEEGEVLPEKEETAEEVEKQKEEGEKILDEELNNEELNNKKSNEDGEVSEGLFEEKLKKEENQREYNIASFWCGFIAASLIFLLIYAVVVIFQNH